MPSSESIANLRAGVFGLTAGICLLYAVLALATGRPDPMPVWIPGVCGLLSALLLMLASRAAGRAAARRAWDEGYRADARRAGSSAFWIALALYPAFGALRAADMIGPDLAMAVMGLLTGASYLALLTWFELRGRGEG